MNGAIEGNPEVWSTHGCYEGQRLISTLRLKITWANSGHFFPATWAHDGQVSVHLSPELQNEKQLLAPLELSRGTQDDVSTWPFEGWGGDTPTEHP